MTKVTYYFGAGASAEALPVVNQIPQRIEKTINLLESDEYLLSQTDKFYGLQINKTKNEIRLALIDDLKWLLEHSKNHASIDTFAKKLYITDEKQNLARLKASFSVYLIIEQAIEQVDNRYDSFFASILSRSATSLPSNLNILSWNYDFQFEKAYSAYSKQKDLKLNQKRLTVITKDSFSREQEEKIKNIEDKFSIIKINGTSDLLKHDWRSSECFADELADNFSIPFFEILLKSYAVLRFSNNDYIRSGLSFAWESRINDETQLDIIEEAKKASLNSEILVVIGYSFPYFNREVDRAIIRNMRNLKKVYFQDKYPSVLKERFLSIREDLSMDALLERCDIGQFLIPNEF